eukprot:GHRR01000344.1.p1 GENE.GHRR01000344.1~~GHRR01000344.1.p1  ORF type:complete len:1159 (+),score=375.53 GHRR01000344.1:116-3592(+)
MASALDNKTASAASSKSVDAGIDVIKPRQTGKRTLWLAAGGVGLLLLGLGVGLAIGLPLAFNNRNSPQAVTLDAADGVSAIKGRTRAYYLAAEPVDWDYAPEGRNLCKNLPFDEANNSLYTLDGVGTKYRKGVYRQYTDATFATPKQRSAEEAHMGLLGPAIYAEVGDTINIVLKNKLEFPINILAGGVRAEGAPTVNPGDTYTARWLVPAAAGPAADGPSTQLWVYRSTLDATRDTNSGLAGPLVVARPGGLNDQGKTADVDREFFLMLQVYNEQNSPFWEFNSQAHADKLANMTEEDLFEANRKFSINGFLYCNMPGLNMTVGEKVRWYVSSLGSEDAIHTAHWHGITFNMSGQHVDQAVVLASSMMVLDAYTDNPGTWLFHCHLTDHIDGGMMALFTIDGETPELKLNGKTREYFIAADEVDWDYVPFGGEMCGGRNFNFSDNAKTFVEAGPDRIGPKYTKAQYVEYTDATFTERKRLAPEWEHLGILGPVIRGVVGDTLLVQFKNNLKSQAVSMHPHGVWYEKDFEGSPYADGLPAGPGDSVEPGQIVVYKWLVPERAGPGPRDLTSIMWMYHSHVNEAADPWAGLLGPIIITTPENADENGIPNDVKREYVLSFMIMDENLGILAEENFEKYLPKSLTSNATALEALKADPGFVESNLMHSINGFMFCNLPGLEFVQGDSARIYFMALGSSADMHSPNSAESQLFLDGHRKQSVPLLPGQMLTTDTIPFVAGKGLLQCHVYDHISAGMSAIYDVKNLQILAAPADAPVRMYYIAAEIEDWNYAPLGFDGCSGNPWNTDQEVFVKTTNETLGSVYRKAFFREYTDGTFTTRKPSPAENGFLGPMLRAEVGDRIVVQFINRLPFEASLQVFGGLAPVANTTGYQVNIGTLDASANATNQQQPAAAANPVAAAGRKLLAGARKLQQGITAAEAEAEAIIAQSVANIYTLNAVQPGGNFKYEWFVPDSAGPASKDGNSVVYAYVSGVDHIKHINAGLVGPLVVYKRGKLEDPGVDKEIPLLFNIQNEMQSQLYEENLQIQQNLTNITVDTTALTFPESNLMHMLNGHVYCNGPTLELAAGSKVRWYVMAFGSEADMHSPVFDGQDVSQAGQPVYSLGLLPSNSYAIDMVANSTGTWNYYCNILDHIGAGMMARMIVS